MPNIHIYVPAFGNQIAGATVRSLMQLAGHFFAKGIAASFSTNSHPDIAEHRNIALTMWYDTMPQATHLLFIDADMGFPPELITDLLMFDKPLCGAVYPKKTIPREWVVSGFGSDQKIECQAGFLNVRGIGTGIMLIRRDVVDTLIKYNPELVDERIELHAIKALLPEGKGRILRFFDKMDVLEGVLSEDLSFCRRWIEVGGEVWGNIAHSIEHVGQHSFRGCYAAEQSRGTADHPGFVVKQCKRGVFRYNPNDTFIGKSLDVYGEWCDFELDLMEKFVPKGGVVVDVGANIGTHTVALSSMVGPEGEVYAIEAQPRLFAMLADNVKINQCPNVKGINGVATTHKIERVRLAPLPPDSASFNFGAVRAAGDGTEQVPGDNIDSLGLDRCDLIKIDVEGTEADVILGAGDTIRRCAPVLYVENNGEDSQALWDVLKAIGYMGFWSIGPYFNPENHFRNPVDVWPGVMPSANIIAVPNSAALDRITNLPLDLPMLCSPHDNWRAALHRPAAAE